MGAVPQVPPEQVRAPVHVAPAQHGCPVPPQSAAPVAQWPSEPQTSPALQVSGGLQQTWSIAPQGVHEPPAQTSPLLQVSPMQQAPPIIPQSVAGMAQWPVLSHARLPQHSLDERHAEPVGPQHDPPAQSKEPQQSDGVVQDAPRGVPQHLPSGPQIAPVEHRAAPKQQDWPTLPQGPPPPSGWPPPESGPYRASTGLRPPSIGFTPALAQPPANRAKAANRTARGRKGAKEEGRRLACMVTIVQVRPDGGNLRAQMEATTSQPPPEHGEMRHSAGGRFEGGGQELPRARSGAQAQSSRDMVPTLAAFPHRS